MNDNLREYIKNIINALKEAAKEVITLDDGDIIKNVSNFRIVLFNIKDNLIPEALKLCPEGEYEPEHILKKTERNLWAMDFTILNRIRVTQNTSEEELDYLQKWIKRYTSDLEFILDENNRRA